MFPQFVQLMRDILAATWTVFLEAGIFILFGYLVAGLIHVFVSPKRMLRMLGPHRYRSVLLASVVGVPLPLCSCGVLPTALSLRKNGAGKGATVSFLIATPESGVDSIVYTYGLLGPFMAIARPISAFITAITAGSLVEFLHPRRPDGTPIEEENLVEPSCGDSCSDASCGEAALEEDIGHAGHGYGHGHGGVAPADGDQRNWFRRAVQYGYGSFWNETAYWIAFGLVLSGIIAALLPTSFVENYLDEGILPLLIMLAIGTPLYMCDLSSTPVAAALVAKGMSPGAALVFLLAGPATNIGSIVVLSRFLGKKVVAIYLASVIGVTLCLGLLLDWIFLAAGWEIVTALDPKGEDGAGWLKTTGAVVMIALMLRTFLTTPPPSEWRLVIHKLGLNWPARRWATVVLVFLSVLYLTQCIFVVPLGQAAMVTRFGQIHGEARTEGWHFRLPPPVDQVSLVDVNQVRVTEVGYREMDPPVPPHNVDLNPTLPFEEPRFEEVEPESIHVTGDGKIVDLRYSVQYRVSDPIAFLTRADEVEEIVRDAATSAGIAVSATRQLADLYTLGRDEAEAALHARVAAILESYNIGIDVERVCLTFVHAPKEVHADFRDYASALHNRETMLHQAREQAAATRYIAEASAAVILASASGAYALETEAAKGRAEALLLEAEAYERNPPFNDLRLRMDAVRRNLKNREKLFISPRVNRDRLEIIYLPESGSDSPQPLRDNIREYEAAEPFNENDEDMLNRLRRLAPNR